jgi:hypothetical protein
VQVVPPEQAMPQAPQLRLSVIVLAQVPPEQAVVPLAQLDEQVLLLQTCVLVQVVPQVPQFALFDDTQLPPQFKRPVPQVQTPDWQVWPDLQAVPHVPQFAESVSTFVQPWEHLICPPEQLEPEVPAVPVLGGALLGLAQPATTRAAPKIAARAADERAWRPNIFKLLYGGIREPARTGLQSASCEPGSRGPPETGAQLGATPCAPQ